MKCLLCNGEGKRFKKLCPKCKGAKEISRKVQQQDYQSLYCFREDLLEAFRITSEDAGFGDELHCSCVPYLRAEISILRKKLADLGHPAGGGYSAEDLVRWAKDLHYDGD